MYSCATSIFPVRLSFPINEWAVNIPLNIIKGSVYKLAALPSTLQG